MDVAVWWGGTASPAGGVANGPYFRDLSPVVREKVRGVGAVHRGFQVHLPVNDNPGYDDVGSIIWGKGGWDKATVYL